MYTIQNINIIFKNYGNQQSDVSSVQNLVVL